MGNPSWADIYFQGHDMESAKSICSAFGSVVLVGYSFGGSLIGHLSHVLTNITAAILYESPLLEIEKPAGTFPVLWIQNDYWTFQFRQREFDETLAAWKQSHHVAEMTGRGRHARLAWGWPPVGHAWDQRLNKAIGAWIKIQSQPH